MVCVFYYWFCGKRWNVEVYVLKFGLNWEEMMGELGFDF